MPSPSNVAARCQFRYKSRWPCLKLSMLSLLRFGRRAREREAVAVAMKSPSGPKRSCSRQRRDPLSDAGILQQVLGYVSARCYLYTGTVSSLWKQSYETVALAEEKRVSESAPWRRRTGIDVPRKTNYSAAFQSVAMLTWAYTSGLQLRGDSQTLQRAAGRHASLLVLAVLHELGLAFDLHTLDGAVASEREDIVGCLHTQHKCPFAWYIGLAPARSGNISMLRFLRQRGYEFGHFAMCSDAAQGGHFEALRYLHSEGCYLFPSIAGNAAASGNQDMVGTSLIHFFKPVRLSVTVSA
jgi:hypothetical protein